MTISVRGKIWIGPLRYPLKKARKTGAAGKLAKLKLKPKSSSAAKHVKKALARKGKVRASLQAQFTDTAGNTVRKQASVRLK